MAPRGPLPNVIIAGISRSGTTTVFDVLATHPDICVSSTKETRFFQSVRYGEPLGLLDSYRAFFRGWNGEPVVLEGTPDYFYGASATARVIDETCAPRIVLVIREPVDRLTSFFRFQRARLQLPADMTLADYVERCRAVPDEAMNDRRNNVWTGLWGGHYDRLLPAWTDRYADRLAVTFFDDLVGDPAGYFAHLCRWLGVDPAGLPSVDTRDNATVAYRSRLVQRGSARAAKLARPLLVRLPSLAARARRTYAAVNERTAAPDDVPAELRRQLTDYYAPSVAALRDQLDAAGVQNLPVWLRGSG